MAKSDTKNALIRRGIDKENAERIVDNYPTLKAISSDGVQGMLNLGFSQSEAEDIIEKVNQRANKPAKSKTKSSSETDTVSVMDPVVKEKEYTETEKKLIGICKKKEYKMPDKVVSDIASRIDQGAKQDEKLTDKEIEALLAKAENKYEMRKMEFNESVGGVCAQSIAEPSTQMNLRTFHNAGVANVNVISGLPRLIEVVGATRNPHTPSMEIPLIEGVDEGQARHIAYDIEVTKLLDVADIEMDNIYMKITVKTIADKMKDRGVRLTDSSDDNIIEETIDEESEPEGTSLLSIIRKKVKKNANVEIDGFNIVITCTSQSNKDLQKIFDDIKTLKIKGVKGITRAVLVKDDKRWKIVTEGSNLREVMNVKYVDTYHVRTNNFMEVYDVLGIEAARNSLIYEAKTTLSAAGAIDIRHIMLVADLMTNDGTIMAITRNGVYKKKSSVLARAAFELTTNRLFRAGMNGEVDSLEGVAENIIAGQPVALGTGAVKLIYTPNKGE